MNPPSEILQRYLTQVFFHAKLNTSDELTRKKELQQSLENQIESQCAQGFSNEEALLMTLTALGHPGMVGEKMRTGFRWIDVRYYSTAKGFFATGGRAIGVFSFGGVAIGLFAYGGLALGLFSLGGLSIGLLASLGGVALGLLSFGGFSGGGIALGGHAVGIIGDGGTVYALWGKPSSSATLHYTLETAPEYLKFIASQIHIKSWMQTYWIYFVVFTLVHILFCTFFPLWIHKRFQKNRDPLIDSIFQGIP